MELGKATLEMQEQEFQAAQSMATLSNVVAGFSIAQNLLIISSILEYKIFGYLICDEGQFLPWLGFTIIFLIAYLCALHFLYGCERNLLSYCSERIKKNASLLHRARVGVVLFVFFLVIATGTMAAITKNICHLGKSYSSISQSN